MGCGLVRRWPAALLTIQPESFKANSVLQVSHPYCTDIYYARNSACKIIRCTIIVFLNFFCFFFSDSFVISNGYARSFCCYLEFHRWFRHYIFCLLFCGYSFNQPLQFLTLSWDFQWLLHTLLKSLKILFRFIQIFKSLLRILKNSSRFQCPLKNSWGFHLLWLKNIIHKLINIAECSLTIVIEFFKAKVNGLWVHRGP